LAAKEAGLEEQFADPANEQIRSMEHKQGKN